MVEEELRIRKAQRDAGRGGAAAAAQPPAVRQDPDRLPPCLRPGRLRGRGATAAHPRDDADAPPRLARTPTAAGTWKAWSRRMSGSGTCATPNPGTLSADAARQPARSAAPRAGSPPPPADSRRLPRAAPGPAASAPARARRAAPAAAPAWRRRRRAARAAAGRVPPQPAAASAAMPASSRAAGRIRLEAARGRQRRGQEAAPMRQSAVALRMRRRRAAAPRAARCRPARRAGWRRRGRRAAAGARSAEVAHVALDHLDPAASPFAAAFARASAASAGVPLHRDDAQPRHARGQAEEAAPLPQPASSTRSPGRAGTPAASSTASSPARSPPRLAQPHAAAEQPVLASASRSRPSVLAGRPRRHSRSTPARPPVLGRHRQAAREDADAALQRADMRVQHDAGDARHRAAAPAGRTAAPGRCWSATTRMPSAESCFPCACRHRGGVVMVPPPKPGSSDVDAAARCVSRAIADRAGRVRAARMRSTALTALVRDDLEACNRLIVERMQSPVALIPQLAAHIVAAGGKRLRPLLTLAAARLCGYRGERHVALAACVEFIHTATLLHDDVVDESALRRGQASANALFGNKPSRAGRRLPVRPRLPADGGGRLARGAAHPLRGLRHHRRGRGAAAGHPERHHDHRGRSTSQVIEGKTAALFAAATQIGAVVADRPAARAGRAARLWPQPRHRLPAGGRRAGLLGRAGTARQDGRRRFPRGQDHPARAARLRARRRGGARLLAPHARGARAGPRPTCRRPSR